MRARSLLVLLSIFWGTIVAALTLGWSHLETKALYLISQDMKHEMAHIHQRENEVPLDLFLDQQIGNIEIDQKE